MINNNSGNKNKNKNYHSSIINKNVAFYRSMYIFFNTNTGQCIFFIDLFYH